MEHTPKWTVGYRDQGMGHGHFAILAPWHTKQTREAPTAAALPTPDRATAERAVTALNAHDELLAALREIAKGEGAYSMDPLTHAGNTIENMKELATDAIEKAAGEKTETALDNA